MTIMEQTNPGTFIAVIASLVIIISAVSFFVKILWPISRKISEFSADWFGKPAQHGKPAKPGVVARLSEVEKATKEANYNSKPNNGGSAYDRLDIKLNRILYKIDNNKDENNGE